MSNSTKVASIYINASNAQDHVETLTALTANWPAELRRQIGNEDGTIIIEESLLRMVRIGFFGDPVVKYTKTDASGNPDKLALRCGLSGSTIGGALQPIVKGQGSWNFQLNGLVTFYSAAEAGQARNIVEGTRLREWMVKTPSVWLDTENVPAGSRVVFLLALKKGVPCKVKDQNDPSGKTWLKSNGEFVKVPMDVLEMVALAYRGLKLVGSGNYATVTSAMMDSAVKYGSIF